MTYISSKTGQRLAALILALTVAVAAAPAHADWHGGPGPGGPGWHDRGWDRHGYYARHDWDRWHGPRPGYVYGPPVAYPPPVYQPAGLNLVFPLNFN